MTPPVRRAVGVAAWTWVALLWAAPALAQGGGDEGRLLREAAGLEARGDLAGASRVLRSLLEREPASSGALFALERVLRTQGRVGEVLPWADRYLAADARAAGVRYMKLRVLVEVDSLDALEAEADGWIAAEPGVPDPYREIARVWERAFGPERALAVVRRAREELDDPAALAVEAGDLLAGLGRAEEAVVEWSRAIGDDGSEVATVQRRVAGLPGDRAALALPLVRSLGADPTTTARRRAGIRIALDAGLDGEALELARRVLRDLPDNARRGFLTDVARRGDEAGVPGVSLWAYRALRDVVGDGADAAALDARVAAAALAAGDTASELEVQARLARGLPAGSAERRRVIADLVRVEAATGDPDDVLRRLEGFRAEFPDAPELDALTAAVAAGLQARGLADRAAALLAGAAGPASALERAYLLLDRERTDSAVAALGVALAGLAPSRATGVIQLMTLLARVGPEARRLLGRAAVRAHRGDPAGAVAAVRAGVASVAAEDRPAVLAHGARMAEEAGGGAEAAELRRALLADFGDAPEAAEATVALARWLGRDASGVPEAIALLEALILDRPNSAVVPGARRELERLRSGSRGEP